MTFVSKKSKVLLAFVVVLISTLFFIGCQSVNSKQTIGVAWCSESNYGAVCYCVNEVGGDDKVLNQIKYDGVKYTDDNKVEPEYLDEHGFLKQNVADEIKTKPYDKSNVKQVLGNIKSVIFPGGADISPSLYKNPQSYVECADRTSSDAARDISDYILMSYCLDNDISVMGICRGMQMYGVVSGGELVQDLPTYYAEKGAPYNNEHVKSGEINGKNVRGNHPVSIVDKHSHIYNIYQRDVIQNPYSSHHQAVISVDPSNTKVTAVANVNGVQNIEAMERADSSTFGLFIQFHPEHSATHWADNNPDKESFISFEDSLKPFRYFLSQLDK